MNAPSRSMTDILLDSGALNPEQLEQAIALSHEHQAPLGRVLVEGGFITEAQLVAALAEQIGMEFIDLSEATVDPSASGSIPNAMSKRHNVLGVRFDGETLVVAMADPGNVVALDDIRNVTGRNVQPIVATREDLEKAITRYCRADSMLANLETELEAEDETQDVIADATSDAPIVKYVNLLITQAITDGASDIHIEPGEHELRVRYRIDGVLHETMTSPRSIAGGVTSRLKVMADMDIAERRKPQDGRLSVMHEGRKIDLRVAALPTVWGEKIVMRILDNSTAQMALSDLGFTDDNFDRFATSYVKPYGMILVTGPTGSGKSTTLYATLNIVSKPQINVITVEDPVEYRIPGINQVQVNNKAGMTFAAALKSILRADPDVVLIGEIRDGETAQIAIEAALTGHLVLSTLHTNDAASAVTRLTEMGIEPFLVGSALDSVLAQRLARRLCKHCKEPYVPTREELDTAGFSIPEDQDLPTLHRPAGCKQCANTGYKGRLALHEIMLVSEEIERMAVAHKSSTEMDIVAREQGMVSLRGDGWIKILWGDTSIEEVLRVVA